MGGLPFHIVFSKKGREDGVTGAFDGEQDEFLTGAPAGMASRNGTRNAMQSKSV